MKTSLRNSAPAARSWKGSLELPVTHHHSTDHKLTARPRASRRPGAHSTLAQVTLEQPRHIRYAPEIIFEREQALGDILEESSFILKSGPPPPYHLHIKLEEDRLIFLISKDELKTTFAASLDPVKPTLKDYFLLCEGFYKEAKNGQSARLETLDSGRRAIHNEGADWLMRRLKEKIAIDHATARRLFTLICVLHIRCATAFKKTSQGQ